MSRLKKDIAAETERIEAEKKATAALSEENRERLGDLITRIAEGVADLEAGTGINRKALIVLLAHESKLPMKTIRTILDSLETLKEEYCQ